jgi:hypothetical protein
MYQPDGQPVELDTDAYNPSSQWMGMAGEEGEFANVDVNQNPELVAAAQQDPEYAGKIKYSQRRGNLSGQAAAGLALPFATGLATAIGTQNTGVEFDPMNMGTTDMFRTTGNRGRGTYNTNTGQYEINMTPSRMQRYGGVPQYEVDKEYNLTQKQIDDIIANGGTIEYLD